MSKRKGRAEVSNFEPFLVTAWDYHSFSSIEIVFQMLDPGIKVVEIEVDGGFTAVVFKGRKPSKKTLKRMIDDIKSYEEY